MNCACRTLWKSILSSRSMWVKHAGESTQRLRLLTRHCFIKIWEWCVWVYREVEGGVGVAECYFNILSIAGLQGITPHRATSGIHLSWLSVTMAIGHDTHLGPETEMQWVGEMGGKVGQRWGPERKIELIMNMWHIVYLHVIIHSLLLFNMYAISRFTIVGKSGCALPVPMLIAYLSTQPKPTVYMAAGDLAPFILKIEICYIEFGCL